MLSSKAAECQVRGIKCGNYKVCASLQHVQHTPTYTSQPLKPVQRVWSFLSSVWQITGDHSDISTVALPQPDSPLPRLTGFEKRRYVCRVLRSFVGSLSCAHGCGRLCGNSARYPQRGFYTCSRYLSAKAGSFHWGRSGHAICAPFIKRETSSSILAEKGKSWRPIGGAPELGREGRGGGGGGGVLVREGGGKRGGEEGWGRRAIPFRGMGGSGISWDSVFGGFWCIVRHPNLVCATALQQPPASLTAVPMRVAWESLLRIVRG